MIKAEIPQSAVADKRSARAGPKERPGPARRNYNRNCRPAISRALFLRRNDVPRSGARSISFRKSSPLRPGGARSRPRAPESAARKEIEAPRKVGRVRAISIPDLKPISPASSRRSPPSRSIPTALRFRRRFPEFSGPGWPARTRSKAAPPRDRRAHPANSNRAPG